MCWELDSSKAKYLMKDPKHAWFCRKIAFVVICILFWGIISFDFQVDLPLLVNHQSLLVSKKIGNARVSDVPGLANSPF